MTKRHQYPACGFRMPIHQKGYNCRPPTIKKVAAVEFCGFVNTTPSERI